VLYALALIASWGLAPLMGGPARTSDTSLAASLAAGFEAAWREPTVRSVLLVTVLMNVLFFPYQNMLPVFAHEVLDAGPEWLGALVAADGLGALVGALVIASRGGFLPHRRVFATSVLVAPVLLLLLAALRWRWACLVILVVMGASESGFAAMQSTLVLLSAPEALRGGAMGILSACIGTQPLGTLWIGFLAGLAGAPVAMAFNGVASLLAIIPAAVPLLRVRARPPGGPMRET
jgi:MFS family permease